METLLLLELLSRGGEAFLADMGTSSFKPATRTPLTGPGYVSEAKRKRPAEGGRKATRPIPYLILTDRGFGLLDGLLGGGLLAVPERSAASVRVLSKLMNSLGTFMKTKGFGSCQVFGTGDRAQGPAPDMNGAGVSRILQCECPGPQTMPGLREEAPGPQTMPGLREEAPGPQTTDHGLRTEAPGPGEFLAMLLAMPPALRLSGGGIKIATVRKRFPDLPPADVDRLLRELQKREKIVLYSHTSRDFITPEDRTGAVTVAGEARHLLYFKK